MQATTPSAVDAPRGPAVFLTTIGCVGFLSTLVAVLLIWTLLAAPAEVTTAAAEGVPELLQVVLAVVYDAMRPILAWI